MGRTLMKPQGVETVGESRSERITCAIRPSDLAALNLVGRARDVESSVLLREWGLPRVLREAKRLRLALRTAA